MATRNEYKQVLAAITTAPHAIHQRQIVTDSLDATVVSNTCMHLRNGGFIKEDSRGNGYFTRRPKRAQIAAFLADPNVGLEGITFDAPSTSVPPVALAAPTMRPRVSLRGVLELLRQSPHAVPFDTLDSTFSDNINGDTLHDVLDDLLDNNIIKADRNTGNYFTRKPMRDRVDAFLTSGDIDDLYPTQQVEQAPHDHTNQDGTEMTPTPITADFTREEYENILAEILDSEHALSIAQMGGLAGSPVTKSYQDILDILVGAKLIKEHADKPGYYFTRKPMRVKITDFLETDMTVEQLLDGESYAPKTVSVDIAAIFPVEEGVGEQYLNMVTTLRDFANIILSQNGR